MPEFKERPKMGKPKAGHHSAIHPRQAARLMKEKYRQELEGRREETDGESNYAADQVEGAGRWAADEAASRTARPRQHRQNPLKERLHSGKQSDSAIYGMARQTGRKTRADKNCHDQEQVFSSFSPDKKARQRGVEILRDRMTARPLPRQSGPEMGEDTKNSGISAVPGGIQNDRTFKERSRAIFKTRSSLSASSKTAKPVKQRHMTVKNAKGAVQRQMTQQMVTHVQRAAKATIMAAKKATEATVRAVTALISGLVGLTGGGVLLVTLTAIIVIAAVASSPFGLYFAAERTAPDAVSVAEAVGTVNVAYNARLAALQAGDYDGIDVTGAAADWPEVLAVFAARYAGAEDGVDVATLDADRVDKLTGIFWDMTAITSYVEAINHPDSDPDDDVDDSWTEHILHITITAKTADAMRTAYLFTAYQNSALDALLADRAALSALAESLSITSAEPLSVLNALPDALSPQRRAVVEKALSLVGKVNYFWGGKSVVIGWDSRWGTLRQVTAEGSPTTGTYRPYGLDCSGFVDWAFYNATDGGYLIGHGGGAHTQHTYCTVITWAEARPGDLVFYPDDEHVGIVCGRDESGDLKVIHCASGYNNVVITGISGFTSVGRPVYFSE